MLRSNRNKARNPGGDDEVTASAIVDLRQADDVKYLRTVLASARANAVLPWKWYDGIPECHYGVSRGARTAGYAKLIAVELGRDGAPEKDAKGMAVDLAAEIGSPYGGRRGLLERFYTHSKVPGDTYLIECQENGQFAGYDCLDADEIDIASLDAGERSQRGEQVFGPGQKVKRITHPFVGMGGMGVSERLSIDIPAENFLGRIWRPSARYVDVADSPMRALESTCELLYLMTLNLKAKITSRLALNGIVFIPTEINQIREGTPGGQQNEIRDSKVLDRLIRAATYAVTNFEDPKAAIPIFMAGPGQFGEMIKHIVMDRDIMETDMKLRAELIDRVLQGLDIEKQVAKGQGDSNHWTAWATEDSERRVNIQPDIETFCWAATRMILHRKMQAANLPQGRILKTALWYDLTAANVKTNLAEDSRQARDRVLIGAPAARRLTGLEEKDAPDPVDYIRQIGILTKDPYLATWGMPEADKIDWEKVGSTGKGPPPDSPADDSKAGPGKSSGGPDDIDSDVPRKLRPA